jgi:protein O-GlcNAc transferase
MSPPCIDGLGVVFCSRHIGGVKEAVAVDWAAETFALAWKHHQAGSFVQAEQLYREILQADPVHVDAWCFLGGVYQAQGRLAEAETHFRRAAELMPDHPSAGDCLGVVVANQGRLEEAGEVFEHLLRCRPATAQLYNNIGYLRYQQARLAEAVAHYHQALRLNPDAPEIHNNLGLALADQSKLDLAVAHCRQALQLRPDFALAHNNLGHFQLKLGRADLAFRSFQQALRCDPDLVTAQSNLLFSVNYDPEATAEFVFAEHCRWGRLFDRRASRPPPTNDRSPERRLRIGYISPDLRIHPLTRYLEPVLAHHDPHQVEVFCYADVAVPDAATKRLQKLAHSWRWINGLSDAQAAECIRGDSIDILVDLAGHTAGNRLRVLAYKPAPVQATWLGYMNTSGLAAVDYRLTDAVLDPPGQAVRDTEELVRLPGGMCCFAPPTDAPDVGPLPALEKGHLTFGSLHNLFKLNGRVFDLWSQLLMALPTARLLMFRDTLTGTAQDYVRKQFTERGIGGERLDLRQGSCAPGYLGIYGEIDVSLDAFPFTGGVTTCESLWMGVPVLSLCGVRPAGRNAAALLATVGLNDWVVQTPQQYVALAVGMASELDRLSGLRAGLRDRVRATLCDAARFTRELEEAYRTMWRRWCGPGMPVAPLVPI